MAFGREAAGEARKTMGETPSRGALRVLILLATLISVATCRPRASQRELAELNQVVLDTVDRLLGPVPRFSGSSIGIRSFETVAGELCPSALARPARPVQNAAERSRLGELSRAIARITQSRGEEAEVLRLRALWELIEQPTFEGRNHMIRLLQAALAREPGSADRKNDLAAAYLLRASVDGQPTELAAALELLEPVTKDPGATPSALFNHAYALQCLTLWDAAQEMWRRVPGAPPGLAAAGNVMSGARDQSAGVAEGDPLPLRRRGEWLLGEWGSRRLRGDLSGSRALLREAGVIGARLEARSRDRLLSSAVGVILQALEDGDRQQLLRLQRGHAAFHNVRGTAIYSECRPDELASAEASLAAAGSPFAGWVRVDQAVCAYFDKDFQHAETILLALRAEARSRGYLSLEGRADWLLGLVRMVQGRFVEADRSYSAAIDLFSRLGETAHAVYLQSLRAKSYDYGGARQEAWHQRLTALARRRSVDDPERLFTIFDEAAQALRRQGFPVAALGFLAEQMRAAERAARETGKTDLLAFTLMYRADLFIEIGRRAEAAADVDRAADIWSRLPVGNESRRRLRAEIDVRRSLLDKGVSPEEALTAFDHAIAFFAGPSNSLGDQVEILKLYKLRAQVELEHGRFAAARDDLLRGIAEMERQRLEVAAMDDRARFLAQGRDLFRALIRLELDQFHDAGAALASFERSSNRVLADASEAHLGGSDMSALRFRAEALRDILPSRTLVVRFGHLADRLLLWTFLDGRMELEQRPLPEADLARQIQLCRDLLSRGASSTEREAACDALAQTVLPKRLQGLPAGSRVLLIPDEALASLPFAALRASPGSPYLVERFRLSYTPSLSSWLAASPTPSPPYGPPQTALFVSDPAFSRELFPDLSQLPAAQKAVAGYASHYGHAEVLSDQRATAPALLAALDHFEVLQFDGHGLTNSQYPERGGLLLAPVDPTAPDLHSSLLTARDLPPRALRHLRLVILGACSTGLTTYRETAEVTGLAAAFLARGVPEVIAAAWRVPDEPSALLLDRFHRELAAGRPTDEALQIAQLALLHSSLSERDRTATWAAFQVFRGRR